MFIKETKDTIGYLKPSVQRMWNFTGRGFMIANISGLEHLFTDKTTATENQRDILDFTSEDLLLDNNTEHLKLGLTG